MTSHRYHLMTTGYRQRRKRVFILILALAGALLLALGFYLGQRAAYSGMGIDLDAYRAMQLELPVAREQQKVLAGELQVQRIRNEVDRRALELVRQELAAQKERIAELGEGLRFYTSLMAPQEIANGLSLRDIELVAREEPRRYAYRIVVQQEARKHELLKGELYAEVFGMLGEEQVSYPMAELSVEFGDDDVHPLRFRYFQAIEGELVLPAGFEPRGVSVVANSSTPRKAEVRERYPWQLQERFTRVGK
ncbi:MAG TPA: hypothetical protein ENH48_11545 [Halieaceae bacterium]|nr:hypothetical protein [Halieaceae bacterium]